MGRWAQCLRNAHEAESKNMMAKDPEGIPALVHVPTTRQLGSRAILQAHAGQLAGCCLPTSLMAIR